MEFFGQFFFFFRFFKVWSACNASNMPNPKTEFRLSGPALIHTYIHCSKFWKKNSKKPWLILAHFPQICIFYWSEGCDLRRSGQNKLWFFLYGEGSCDGKYKLGKFFELWPAEFWHATVSKLIFREIFYQSETRNPLSYPRPASKMQQLSLNQQNLLRLLRILRLNLGRMVNSTKKLSPGDWYTRLKMGAVVYL